MFEIISTYSRTNVLHFDLTFFVGFHNIIRIKTMFFICLENKLEQICLYILREAKKLELKSDVILSKQKIYLNSVQNQ